MEASRNSLRLERTFPPRPDSCPKAREFVRQALAALGLARVSSDGELLVGEMAVNAVFHARTYFTVTVTRTGRTARIEVHDESTVMPRSKPQTEELLTLGRGMTIIENVSDRWGTVPTPAGKYVWVEVDG